MRWQLMAVLSFTFSVSIYEWLFQVAVPLWSDVLMHANTVLNLIVTKTALRYHESVSLFRYKYIIGSCFQTQCSKLNRFCTLALTH